MFRRCLFFLLLLPSFLLGSKQPEIDAKDVKTILSQILESHASFKQLNSTLARRFLVEFLEELDPLKTYLLAGEVEPWLSPSEEILNGVISGIENDAYDTFFAMHETMCRAIRRRQELEVSMSSMELPKGVSPSEFKGLSWARNSEDLQERLLRIKSLQAAAAERLGEEFKERTLQRIEKKRLNREEELLTQESHELELLIFAHFLKAVAASLDTHTAYFTPGEASQFMIQVQQRLFGIGAQLRDDFNGFRIVKIIEGGPAQGTGLKNGDRVVAINSEPVVGMDIGDAVNLIRGEEGTLVYLTVLRDNGETGLEESHEIKIVRGEVVIQEARIQSGLFPYGDGVIAHVRLHAFYQDPMRSSASDVCEELAKIRRNHKIKGVVLDLRHNSGGVLPQAVAVTGLFITKGIVVSIKDNNGKVEHLRNVEGKTVWDGPLLVLTSKASASAAEIVAQTLQDYGRAIVVGDDHTFGKGTFQTFTLDSASNGKVNPKGEFKVTRGRYYTVSGKSPQLVGVRPDVVVPGILSNVDLGEQHAKYPLENDHISANFHDDLSDIPVVQRDQIGWLYRFNLQQKLSLYTRHVPLLQRNSEQRLSEDKLYQSFLTEIAHDEMDPTAAELFAKGDLQLGETLNIMKDLIVLLN